MHGYSWLVHVHHTSSHTQAAFIYQSSTNSLTVSACSRPTLMVETEEAPYRCPFAFDCGDINDTVSIGIGPAPSYVAISSSLLSCAGTLVILATYYKFPDLRSVAQTIITLLAVADFFTAAGYVVGSINYLVHFNDTAQSDCKLFERICSMQSLVTSWSTLSSCAWTCILAIHFFLVVAWNKQASWKWRRLLFYNVFAWVSPGLIMVPLLATGKLGFAHYTSSNWCYIKVSNYSDSLSDNKDAILYMFLAGKLWEIGTYILILFFYSTTLVWIKYAGSDEQAHKLGRKVNKRLLAIPLAYIFLRIWGTSQFFFSIFVGGHIKDGCVPPAVQKVFLILGIFQAVGDGGQGWSNTILYIFASKTLKERWLWSNVHPACNWIRMLIQCSFKDTAQSDESDCVEQKDSSTQPLLRKS